MLKEYVLSNFSDDLFCHFCNGQTLNFSMFFHSSESTGPRMSSNNGRRFSKRTNRPTHNSDSSTDSDYEHHNSSRPQRLLNSSSMLVIADNTSIADDHKYQLK